jgi:hypothetical protein
MILVAFLVPRDLKAEQSMVSAMWSVLNEEKET